MSFRFLRSVRSKDSLSSCDHPGPDSLDRGLEQLLLGLDTKGYDPSKVEGATSRPHVIEMLAHGTSNQRARIVQRNAAADGLISNGKQQLSFRTGLNIGMSSLVGPRRLNHFGQRIRLLMSAWSPMLQFLTLLTLLLGVGWVMLIFNRMAMPNIGGMGDNHSPRTSQGLHQNDLLSKFASKEVGWPWNTCGSSNEDVNRWLGQGPARARIDELLRTVDARISSDVQRRKATERYWCSCLTAGSKSLIKLLEEATGQDERTVNVKHSRR
jgi:hypothetical protein